MWHAEADRTSAGLRHQEKHAFNRSIPHSLPAARSWRRASLKPMGPTDTAEYLTVAPGLLAMMSDGLPDVTAQEPLQTQWGSREGRRVASPSAPRFCCYAPRDAGCRGSAVGGVERVEPEHVRRVVEPLREHEHHACAERQRGSSMRVAAPHAGRGTAGEQQQGRDYAPPSMTSPMRLRPPKVSKLSLSAGMVRGRVSLHPHQQQQPASLSAPPYAAALTLQKLSVMDERLATPMLVAAGCGMCTLFCSRGHRGRGERRTGANTRSLPLLVRAWMNERRISTRSPASVPSDVTNCGRKQARQGRASRSMAATAALPTHTRTCVTTVKGPSTPPSPPPIVHRTCVTTVKGWLVSTVKPDAASPSPMPTWKPPRDETPFPPFPLAPLRERRGEREAGAGGGMMEPDVAPGSAGDEGAEAARQWLCGFYASLHPLSARQCRRSEHSSPPILLPSHTRCLPQHTPVTSPPAHVASPRTHL